MILVDHSRKLILLRRSLVMTIVLGVLLVPATCSHAPGPHSIFIDPREAAASEQHGHHHTPPHQADAHEGTHNTAGPHETGPSTSGGTSVHDLPSNIWMTIIASTMLLAIPQVTALPTTQSPEAPRSEQTLRAASVPVDVPPPRAGMFDVSLA